MTKEDQIIFETIKVAKDGTIQYSMNASELANKLGGIFGKKYNLEMVRSRRKRLVTTIKSSTIVDLSSPSAKPAATSDPHGLVLVPFTTEDTAIIINDVHVPYHDDTAFSIMYQIMRDVKPTHLIVNGDFVDFAAISSFPNAPGIPSIEKEMSTARGYLKILRNTPSLKYAEYKFGNHEFRYVKYLWEHTKSLGNMVRSLDEPQGLDLARWNVTGYHQDTALNNFRVTHGEIVRSGAGHSAEAELDARLISGISGHTHRAAYFSRSATDRQLYWVENGCLCKKDMFYVGAKGADWQHAFSLLRFDGQDTHVELINIINYKAYFNGIIYTKGS